MAPTTDDIVRMAIIRVKRRTFGISQAALAAQADTTRWRINQLEKGFLVPRAGELDRLLGILSTGPQSDDVKDSGAI